MGETMIRVDDALIDALRGKYPELRELKNATLVDVALRKLLEVKKS